VQHIAARMLAEMRSAAAPAVTTGPTWTPELVGQALVEAVRWVQYAAGPVGPAGYATVRLPSPVLSLEDHAAAGWGLPERADDDVPDRPSAARLTPAQVSRHMAVLDWPARYLIPGHEGSARLVGLWAMCKASRRPFNEAARRRGIDRSLAYRYRDKGLSIIAMGLTLDAVPLDPPGR
jgi:hypothetical protein